MIFFQEVKTVIFLIQCAEWLRPPFPSVSPVFPVRTMQSNVHFAAAQAEFSLNHGEMPTALTFFVVTIKPTKDNFSRSHLSMP